MVELGFMHSKSLQMCTCFIVPLAPVPKPRMFKDATVSGKSIKMMWVGRPTPMLIRIHVDPRVIKCWILFVSWRFGVVRLVVLGSNLSAALVSPPILPT